MFVCVFQEGLKLRVMQRSRRSTEIFILSSPRNEYPSNRQSCTMQSSMHVRFYIGCRDTTCDRLKMGSSIKA